MRVQLSLLFLLSVIIAMMLRFRHKGDGLTLIEFLLCGVWGFLLAGSSFAPTVHNIITTAAQVLGR